MSHGRDEHADPDRRAGGGRLTLPLAETFEDGQDDLVKAQPLLDMQLGSEARFGIHDAIRGQIDRTFTGYAPQLLLGLHHRHGVREGLQVTHQRAAVGGIPEPATQLIGIGGRQGGGIPALLRQVDHGLRP